MTKKYFGFRGKALHNSVATVAGIGFLLFGYDQGVMGGLLTLPQFLNQFPKMNDSSIQGVTVAIYEIGCMMGALATLSLGNRYGRRKVIFVGAWIMTAGAILQCTSFSLAQLIVGRIVTGLGNGLNTATVPMWQSECAKPENRGQLVMIEGALITCGIMISYWVDFGFSFVKDQADWRFPLAFQIVFAIILIATVLSLPESPRWLIMKNRLEEARDVMACFEDTTPQDPLITAEVNEVVHSLELSDTGGSRRASRMLFTFGNKKQFHRVMLGVWNQVMQQLTGINLITYYAAKLYQDSIGLQPMLSRLLGACNGTEYFMASWIAFFTIERVGRRKLMLYCSAGQAVTMGILTATVWAAEEKGSKGAGIAAAVFLFVFNSIFAIGWLGMTWLYPAEITPLETRAPANGLSTAANWLSNFLVVMITPVAFANIKYYTYTVFAALNAAIFVCVYIFYPETAGRSLEEIDKIFEKANPRTPWDVVHIARHIPRQNARLDVLHGGTEQGTLSTAEKDFDREYLESASSISNNSH